MFINSKDKFKRNLFMHKNESNLAITSRIKYASKCKLNP